MLIVDHLHAFYGQSHVLNDVSLVVKPGEMVALLGRNGSGRSTLAKAIMGMVQVHGSIQWRGQEILGKKTFEIARLGLGYVPESRDVFTDLTVEQNLLLGQKNVRRPGCWSIAELYRLFPQLKKRSQVNAAVLSGGEQQMLALCRTLMGDPGLIIVDEPTEGLAPQVVAQLGAFLQTLKAQGVSVLLVEQKLALALDISDRCCVMGRGRVMFDGTPGELRQAPDVCNEWLGVSAAPNNPRFV
jgi:branched-chain amino acid transport system ATP-binding protein